MSEALGFEEEEAAREAAGIVSTEDLQADFMATFVSSPSGQRVLIFLANYCHQVRPTYTRGEPEHTAFLEGRRNVLLKIMEYVHMDDAKLIQLAQRGR